MLIFVKSYGLEAVEVGVVVVVVVLVEEEEAPVVLGADEVDEAQGLGRGEVFVVPGGAEGPGLGVAGRGRG